LTLSALTAAVAVISLAFVQRRRRDQQRQRLAQSRREAADAEFLALALRGGDLGLWDRDLLTGKRSVNDRWLSMLGLTRDAAGDDEQGWLDLLHPDDRDAVLAAQRAHLAGRSPSYEARCRMRHSDGHWVWVLDRGRVVERGADGRPLRMAGTHLDITERVLAEEALRASEHSLAVTLHSIGDAVIATDTAGIVTRMNATAERLTGWPAAQGIGLPLARLFRIFNARTRLPLTDPVAKVLASGETVGLANDTVLAARDGAEYQIADSAAPIRAAGGEVQGVVLVFSDVTERYRVEQALRDRERQLSLISDTLPSPVARVDRDGHYLFVNAAFGRWLGLRPDQVLGRTQQQVLAPAKWAEILPHVERARAGDTVTFDHLVAGPDGPRHTIVTMLPDRDEEGVVRGHFTVMTDITERKRAEDALRRSEQKSRSLLNALRSGVVVHGPDMAVRDANPAACQLLGLSLEQMRGLAATDPRWQFLEEDGTPMALERYPVQQVRRSGLALQNFVGGVVQPGRHRPVWVLCNAYAVHDDDGRVLEIIVTITDISDRKQAEAERSAMERQLREVQKMESIGTLAGGIAHDFNNILAAIMGNLALARDDLADQPGHQALASLDQIQIAGLRARSLVQQILTFSRRQPQQLTVQPLRPILDETLSLLRATLPASVRLDSRLADGPLQVQTDATQLQQVVMNLCTNAWQSLPGGRGRIEVGLGLAPPTPPGLAPGTTLAPGPHAHVWVSDTGTGMDASTRERIFDPFFTTKPVGQGTGLGLS
ncbi:MAG: PAS domain S-box protein, partial [Chitinophagaceae bacterium]|nr:PAS domain S-box protein [Rubrivivax sp.]